MSIVKVTIEWILRLVGRAARVEGPWEHPAKTSMCLTHSQMERYVKGLLDLPADLASHVAEACRYCSLVKREMWQSLSPFEKIAIQVGKVPITLRPTRPMPTPQPWVQPARTRLAARIAEPEPAARESALLETARLPIADNRNEVHGEIYVAESEGRRWLIAEVQCVPEVRSALIGRQSLIEVEDLREVIKGLENADGKIRIRWNRAEAGQGEGVFDEQGRLELKVGEVTPNFNCLELWKALLAVLIAIQSTGREVWAAARETTRGGRAAPRRGLGRRVVQVAAVSGVLVLGLRTPCHVTNEGTEGLAAAQTASQDWKAEEPNIPPCDKANPSATKEAESGNKSLPTQSGSPSWPSARLNVKPAQPSPATKAEEEALEKKSIPAEEKYRGVWRW